MMQNRDPTHREGRDLAKEEIFFFTTQKTFFLSNGAVFWVCLCYRHVAVLSL